MHHHTLISALFLVIGWVQGLQLAEHVPQDFSKRDPAAGGGFGLNVSPCPGDTSQCNVGCCPNSLTCTTGSYAYTDSICCPGNSACGTALETIPYCADSSWTLWYAAGRSYGDYFCCQEGLVGDTSGDCVSNQTQLASTLAAFSLVPGETGATAWTAQPTGAAATTAVTATTAATAISVGSTSSHQGIISSLRSDLSSAFSSAQSSVVASLTGSATSASHSSDAAERTMSPFGLLVAMIVGLLV